MGKRKKSSRKPQGPKRKEALDKTFTCLFCNHEESVRVQLWKKEGYADLKCSVCGQTFRCSITYLSEAIDVYFEWVDAAEAVAQESHAAGGATNSSRTQAGLEQHAEDDEDKQGYDGEGIVGDNEYD